MGVTLSAAGSLEWLSGVLQAEPADLVAPLGETPAGPSSILFLPYLSGERTPHNDVAVRGAFVGLDQAHGRKDMTQAVLEGVAFAFKDCLDVADHAAQRAEAADRRRRRLALALLAADHRHRPRPADRRPRGRRFRRRLRRGAPRALIAAENADPFEVCAPPAIREVIEPIPDLVEAYAAAHATYSDLYPAIKEAMPR